MDLKTLERVNPVFNTAKMCLYQLAVTGDEDAKALSDKLKLGKETQNSETTRSSEGQMKVGTAMMEIRYRTVEEMARASKCPTLVDLPCGYTPRGIEFSKSDMKYIGLDLPATILEAEPVIRSLIEKDKQSNVKYAGCDATNYASLEKALYNVRGPICITTEGLLMYFTESEVGVLCDNIRKLLKKNGGCWIVADCESALQYIMTVKTFYGDDFMSLMADSKQKVQEKADVEIGKSSLIIQPGPDVQNNIKKAMEFLAMHGLKAERLTVADYMPSLTGQSKEEESKLKESALGYAYWKITLLQEGDSGLEESIDFTQEFSSYEARVSARITDDKLSLLFAGRIDTLSAPEVLKAFENLKEDYGFGSVEIDCEDLMYISSAGLRVLLIMHKETDGNLTLTGANETVQEILEQTGFDSILDIR